MVAHILGGMSCDKACQETLIKARDARWGQGIQARRIQYYYLLAADKFDSDKTALHKAFSGLILLHGSAAQRNALFEQFHVVSAGFLGKDNRLYLVDPAGMLMMQYPYGFRHIGLMEDLKYLLKWSQIA